MKRLRLKALLIATALGTATFAVILACSVGIVFASLHFGIVNVVGAASGIAMLGFIIAAWLPEVEEWLEYREERQVQDEGTD